MQKNLLNTKHFSFHPLKTMAAAMLLGQGAHATNTQAINWLKLQTQSDLKSDQFATELRSIATVSEALQKLDGYQTSFSIPNLDGVKDTDSLARKALALNFQQLDETDFLIVWSKLEDLSNDDGGFGHISGWQSNPIDTASVLIALNETQALTRLSSDKKALWERKIQLALKYLYSQQQADGSYQVISQDSLYTTAYVLSALTPYVQSFQQAGDFALKSARFLESKQIRSGVWTETGSTLFIDAMVSESLHPYSTGKTYSQDFSNRAMSQQLPSGSWGEDAFTTAILAKAINTLAQEPKNPILEVSSVSLTVLDSETGLPVVGAKLSVITGPTNSISLSNGSGVIKAINLEKGDYRFELERDGYSRLTFEIGFQKAQNLNIGDIKLTPSADSSLAQVQGLVVDSTTGLAISNAQVTVVMVDGNGVALAEYDPVIVRTGAQGNYQALLPSDGFFGIAISKEGYFRKSASGQAEAGDIVLFNAELAASSDFSAQISAAVVDNLGLPITNAMVYSAGKALATTDQSGRFSVSAQEPGSLKWLIVKDGYFGVNLNLSISEPGNYDAGVIALASRPDDADPDQVTQATGTLQVQPVTGLDNKPVNGFDVTAELLNDAGEVLQTQQFSSKDEAASGKNFNTLIMDLTEGRWRVAIKHPSYQSYVSTVQVTADQVLILRPKLSLLAFGVVGEVIDSQTDLPIKNVAINAFDPETNQLIWSGTTSATGEFQIPQSASRDRLNIEFANTKYLSGSRSIDRDFFSDSIVDLEQVRLRPVSAQVVLPDLIVSSIDASSLLTDQQTLKTSGKLQVSIANDGNAAVAQEIEITAFEDKNNNHVLDADELIFGRKQVGGLLSAGNKKEIEIQVEGVSLFRDAPITVVVDSLNQIAEKDEANNALRTSDLSVIKPPAGTMEAEVVWKNTTRSNAGVVIAPLEDTNGDGQIGTGDIASVIVASVYSRRAIRNYNVLDGITGETKFSLPASGQQELAAVGDVDGDGLPDIVVPGLRSILVYSNTGQLKKSISATLIGATSGWASDAVHPAIADLDNDGTAEIIFGNAIFKYEEGQIVYPLPSGATQAIADIDGDGELEIIGDLGVSRLDGTLLYKFKNSNGTSIKLKFLAVGDVLGGGEPQVVSVYGNQVLLFRLKDGELLATYNPTSSAGGPPVIADFDGDGTADIGLARAYSYVAMRGDGSEIWSTPIRDGSGGTGSTVFDFDGDGASEAVHFDERNLRIYDSATGTERVLIANRTATAHEYPVVADVDADGHADIVITSGSVSGDGVRLISGKNKDWAAARNIWNQYSYHSTNINDDLSVPQYEPDSWKVHNTYRTQWQPGNTVAAADLTASYIQVEDNGWFSDSKLTVRVGNAGGKRVKAGAPVAFYRVAPVQDGVTAEPELVGVTATSKDLESGAFEDVTLSYPDSLKDFGELVVVVNDAGAGVASTTGIPEGETAGDSSVIQEFSRTNNSARLSVGGSFQSYTLAGELNDTNFSSEEAVQITATAANLGSFDADAVVRVSIVDSANNVLAVLPDQNVELIAAPDQSVTLSAIWNTGNTRPGSLRAKVDLVRSSFTGGEAVVASTNLAFAIESSGLAAGQVSTSLSSDKAAYEESDVVSASLALKNTSLNTESSSSVSLLELRDAGGQPIWSSSLPNPGLAPNQLMEQSVQVPLSGLPAGNYTLTSTTQFEDSDQADQINSITIVVNDNASSLAGISGVLSLDQSKVESGEVVRLSWSVSNRGSALSGLPLRIVLLDASNGELVGSPIYAADISLLKDSSLAPVDVDWIGSVPASLIDRPLSVMLQAQTSGGDWSGLSQQGLMITEPPLIIDIFDSGEATGSAGPLLVYYDCPHASRYANNQLMSPEECLSYRADQVGSYLNRAQVPYTLTHNKHSFEAKLRSGVYGNFWVLGEDKHMTSLIRDEVVEAAYRGEGLSVDVRSNHVNARTLLALAGAKNVGNIELSSSVMKLVDDPSSTVPSLLTRGAGGQIGAVDLIGVAPKHGHKSSRNWPAFLDPLTEYTKVEAVFDGSNVLSVHAHGPYRSSMQSAYPAVVTAPYGQGYPSAFAFDLIDSLSEAASTSDLHQTRWDLVTEDLTKSRRSAVQSSYAPEEAVSIPVSIENQSGQDRVIEVVVDLPEDALWLGFDGGLDASENGTPQLGSSMQQVSTQLQVPANTDLTQWLSIRLPNSAGNKAIRVSVYRDHSQTENNLVLSQENRYLVRGISERIALIRRSLESLDDTKDIKSDKHRALTYLDLVERKFNSGHYEHSIDKGTKVVDSIISLPAEVANKRQIRLEVSELIHALEIQWFMQNGDYNAKHGG